MLETISIAPHSGNEQKFDYHTPSFLASYLPLCSWPNDTSPNDARQVLGTHRKQHADRARDYGSEEDTHASEQDELTADVLLLARVSSPLHRLRSAIVVCAYDSVRALAAKLVAMSLDTFTMTHAGVRDIVACFLRSEVLRHKSRQGEI